MQQGTQTKPVIDDLDDFLRTVLQVATAERSDFEIVARLFDRFDITLELAQELIAVALAAIIQQIIEDLDAPAPVPADARKARQGRLPL
jgi:hypothetical protein